MPARDAPPRGEVAVRALEEAIASSLMTSQDDSATSFRWAGMVVTVHSRDDVHTLLPDWRSLYARTRSWSPFADPDLQLAWCRMFLRPGAERIVAVRRAGGRELVAVLPMFAPLSGVTGRIVRYLRPFGGHIEALINEMPEIALDPDHARPALAAAVAWLASDDGWDFVELSLRSDQPWVEARWLVDAGLESAIVVHKKAYPSIVLDLPASGEPLVLKRNLRESLRRSRNRMKSTVGDWRTVRDTPDRVEWAQALDDLIRLHQARSEMDERAPKHVDVFANTSQRDYIQLVADAAGSSTPVIYRLVHDRTAVAALLVFEYPDRTWVSVSGAAPDHWRFGAVTALQEMAVRDAAAAGRRTVVFSVGIDTAKLRWSETVQVRNGFIIAHGRRRSRWLFRLYWLSWSYASSLVDVSPYASAASRRHRRLVRWGAGPGSRH